ncbi:MAG: hypothetical protein DHS20C14_21580 [Phycisphaeraceae bacterium]|nr:MAG: hypothetical protein DHS20C14_21580 [Phycisphaeraceae bacterium]
MNKAYLIGAAAVCGIVMGNPAHARIVVEDFTGPDGLSPGYDPFFDYDFGGSRDFDSGDAHNLFIGSLLLSPERVVISFNTDPGEEILGVTIRAQELRAIGQTLVTFRGTLGTHSVQSSVMVTAESYQAPMASLGELTSIEISGMQTIIRDITVETADPVPAPGGVLLLGAAGSGLIARRRRR